MFRPFHVETSRLRPLLRAGLCSSHDTHVTAEGPDLLAARLKLRATTYKASPRPTRPRARPTDANPRPPAPPDPPHPPTPQPHPTTRHTRPKLDSRHVIQWKDCHRDRVDQWHRPRSG